MYENSEPKAKSHGDSESLQDSTFGSEEDKPSRKESSNQPSKIKKIRSKDDLDIQNLNINPKPSVKKAISCPSDISNVSLKKVKKVKDVKKEEERGKRKSQKHPKGPLTK